LKSTEHLSIDHLLKRADNKFLLSNAIAGRAKQIGDGSLPYVNDFDPTNPIITALKEVANDKIKIKILKPGAKRTKTEENVIRKFDDFDAVAAFERLSRNAKAKKTVASTKKGKK
jgi:DNA-directed RNA polymerase subunit K/omega